MYLETELKAESVLIHKSSVGPGNLVFSKNKLGFLTQGTLKRGIALPQGPIFSMLESPLTNSLETHFVTLLTMQAYGCHSRIYGPPQ